MRFIKINTNHPAYPWICWLLAALLYLIQYGLFVFPSAISTDIQQALHIDKTDLGLFASAFLYTFVLLQIPAGLLFDHFSSRAMLTLSAFLLTLGCVVVGFSSDLTFGVIGRLIMGVGGSLTFVGAIYLGKNWFLAGMFPVIVGLTEALSGFGEVGLPTLIAHFKQYQDWRVIILEIGVVIFVLMIMIAIFVRDKESLRVKHHVNPWKDFKSVLRNKLVWILALYAGMAYAHMVVMADMWGIPFLEVRYRLSEIQAILENSLAILGFTIGCVTVGWLTHYMSERRLMLICIIVEVIVQYVACFVRTDVYVTALGIFLLGLTSSPVVLTFDIVKRVVPETSYGMAVGFINMFLNGLGVLLMPLVGYLMPRLMFNVYFATAPLMLSVLIAFAIVIWFNLRGFRHIDLIRYRRDDTYL